MKHTKTAQILGLAVLLALSGVAACDAGDGAPKPQSAAVSAPEKAPAAAPAESADPIANADGFKDIVMGNPDAPIEVIEFASMTCGHCAQFNRDVFPDFKRLYVDTGKAKYILRHFLLNGPDMAASMLARCGATSSERYYGYVEMFLNHQDQWIPPWQEIGQQPENVTLADLALKAKMDLFVRPTGMTRDKVVVCLNNDKLKEDLMRMRMEGIEKYQVKGTPAIFINGKPYEGKHTFDEFEQALRKAM